MSETKKRKVFSSEFKVRVGLEAVWGVKTINEIGQEYDVHPMQIGQWKKAIQGQAKTLKASRWLAVSVGPEQAENESPSPIRVWHRRWKG